MRTILLLICAVMFTVTAWSQTNEMVGLSQIKSGMRSKRISSHDRSGLNEDYLAKIKPGEKRVIAQMNGSGIINHIWMTMSPEPKGLNRNDIVIRMYWDGNIFPSVASPLGPFFGQGWNEAYNFNSQPLSASPLDGRALVSYFAMPFAKGARIEIENQSDKDIDGLYYYVDYYEMDKLPADYGRFHAWYNYEITATDSVYGENEVLLLGKDEIPNLKGQRNYNIVDIKGKGQFVGVNYYVNNPTPMWYGEGDDMIFIDGQELPTLNGTGTEDYFNTAFCPKEVFSNPYYGYPRVNSPDKTFETGWMGRTHLYRFHIVDPIYFDKSLRFTIEHGRSNVLTLELASVAYWYQTEATKIPEIKAQADRKPRRILNPFEILRWRDEWRKSKGNGTKLWGWEK
ncbi:MAG: glycoside hydrolase family 172 protein [Chryseolinea sp.]